MAVDAGHVYWANPHADTIGRANLDGTGVNQSFITGTAPVGVAVDAGHVYWANAGAGHDRARQPGRHGRQPELHHRRRLPRGVAVDAGHVYWANDHGAARSAAPTWTGRA